MKDSYLRVITWIGAWFAVITVFGMWEYNILKAEMVLNQKLLSHGLVVKEGPLTGGGVTYVVEMLVWTSIILLLGLLWSEILFPRRNFLEKIVFSLVLGVFAMPLSIFIPFVAITSATVITDLLGMAAPAFVGTVLTKIVELFSNGQEQIYEFANVTFLFLIGLVVLLFRKVFVKASYPSQISSPM